jgi:YggT family protein
VSTFFEGFDSFLYILRITLFVVVMVLAVVCLIDWLVRTRRINPFNPVARYMRSTVDPLMAPVERRIVRAGGLPTSAPWWSLVFVVIGTIVLISLLGFLRGQMLAVASSSQMGAGGILVLLVRWIFGILRLALIVRIVSSWFGMSPYSRWIRWSYQLTDPILTPLRQIVPTIGVIDITPIIAWFLLGIVQWLVLGLLTGG